MPAVRLFGARVVLNRYFSALLVLLALGGLLQQALTAFSVVLLHELAHALAAKARGISLREIELLPFGGVARTDGGIEADPGTEAFVALAGPALNLILAGAAWAARELVAALPSEWGRSFIEINAVLAAFNLLPALPLDGGRILRAGLSCRIGLLRATRRAAGLSKVIAILLGLAGAALLGTGVANASLIAVAFFLFWAAAQEERAAVYAFLPSLARRTLDLQRAGVLPSRHLAATGAAPVKQVLPALVPRAFHLIWVVDGDGRIVGVATETELIRTALEAGMETPLERVARPVGRECGAWGSGKPRRDGAGN